LQYLLYIYDLRSIYDYLIITLWDYLPSRKEVSTRVGHIAGHAGHNGPFTTQVLDHDGGEEHGGDDDGGIDDAQRGHPHPVLCIQATLENGEGSKRSRVGS